MLIKTKRLQRERRHKRVRAKIYGTAKRPRFSVFRSNKYIYAQLIDDDNGKTIVSVNVKEVIQKSNTKLKSTKTSVSFEAGELLAKKAIKKKIKVVVFDRGGYKYHGRVMALADGARKGGLKF